MAMAEEHCKAKGGGGTDYPEYAVLSRSSEALCCAVDGLLTALAFASPDDEGARWRQASEKVLLQHKARLNELSASDPRQWNEEFEAEDQLFEFTGANGERLSQDLDRLQQQQRRRAQQAAQLRRRRQRSRAALALRDFHLAMATQLAQVAEMEPEISSEEDVHVTARSTSSASAEDLLDMEGEPEPVAWASARSPASPVSGTPSDLLDLQSDLIDVSSPLSSPAAGTGAGADADVPVPRRADGADDGAPEDLKAPPPEKRSRVEEEVEQWQRGKNLQALLASLHLLVPETTWAPRSLADLLDPSALKSAYREALLTFHPDKFPERPILGRCVVDALVKAHRENSR